MKVTFEQKQDGPDKRNVVFNVDRNERHKLGELAILGNHYFRREDLREQMIMQPAGGLLLYGLLSSPF